MIFMKTDVNPFAPSCLGLGGPNDGHANSGAGLPAFAQKLARIEAALSRMEKGRYGYCRGCEGRIALHRLEADPAEAVCESCDTGKDSVR